MKKAKTKRSLQRNRVVLYIGIALVLFLTSLYQLLTLNRAGISSVEPQYEHELAKTLELQKVVKQHLNDFQNAKNEGKLETELHAQQLSEYNKQIAHLSNSISQLQERYAKAAAANAVSKQKEEDALSLRGSDTPSHFAAKRKEADSVKGREKSKLPTQPVMPPKEAPSTQTVDGGSVRRGDEVPRAAGTERTGNTDSDIHPGAAAANADPAVRHTQEERAKKIREAIQFVWTNYRKHAWGQDDLRPVSGRGASAGFNHAVTLLDSLDTLWIVGLRDEFDDAVDYASKNLVSKLRGVSGSVSAFETTIRSLGGLEGAHALSQDARLVPLIEALGERLDNHVGSNGITTYRISGGKGGMGCNTLAESGTNQLELHYLSQVTGNSKFGLKSASFYPYIEKRPSLDGLYPNCFERGKGKITFGADGDSFYEYLIKAWLQTGRKDDRLWRMYNDAIDGMDKWLVKVGDDGLTYLQNINWAGSSKSEDHAMEHLTCFVPGWLMLGQPYQKDPARKAHIRDLAERIAYTCWQMYEQQPTGIAPERVKAMKMDLSKTDTREYILRPEALEGFWYMWELTGDPKYREWSWTIFENFQKHLKTSYGYGSLKDVRNPKSQMMDRMESFFLAETMKYMYLLHDPDQSIRLSEFVFNTEAHPLPLPH